MFKKRIFTLLLILIVLFCKIELKAQDSTRVSPIDIGLFHYNKLWQQGPNAAGLRQDFIPTFGKTGLYFSQTDGGFKLAQQAKSNQQVNFESERFQQIGRTFFYGKFSYVQQWDKEIRFSDVLDPYRGTPYILMDSIGGDWKKQLYGLTLKAASPVFFKDRLTLGLGTTLNVGTGARQNDPRPLSTTNEITLTPSLTMKLKTNSLIGLNGLFSRYREDISLEIKNTSVNHYLYKSLGLGQLELPTAFTTGASRVYQGSKWGGDLQYQFKRDQLTWLSTLGYRTYKERVSDGTSVPRKSGTWKQSVYQLNSNVNIDGKNLSHRFALKLQRLEDQGIEFHEFYNATLKTWQTLLEAEFYLAETDHASLTYTVIKPNVKQSFKWLAEIGANYYATSKNYLIPVSAQEISKAGIWLKGTKVWTLNGTATLQTGVEGMYTRNLTNSLFYVPITGDRTLLAKSVLYPDQSYLSADGLSISSHIQYAFKINKYKNVGFAIDGDITHQRSLSTGSYENAIGSRNYFNIGLTALY